MSITPGGIIKSFYFGIVAVMAIATYLFIYNRPINEFERHVPKQDLSNPTSVEMYYLIEKYSDKYMVPKYIAYNVAYKETKYRGPFHWTYTPNLTSYAGAVGPMQVMISTANRINPDKTTKSELRENIEINIETSMRLLQRLHRKYGRWDLACGAYNTGKPIVNDYARFCVTNKKYYKNWVFYQK